MHMFQVCSHEERYHLKKKTTKDMQAVCILPLLLTFKTLPDVQPSGSLGFWLVPNFHLV